jgi:hypothetical protein
MARTGTRNLPSQASHLHQKTEVNDLIMNNIHRPDEQHPKLRTCLRKASQASHFPMSNKYRRQLASTNGMVDVYDVLEAFNVSCPARQHAVKKLLCAGARGAKVAVQDLEEAADAVQRAIEMERQRGHANSTWLARDDAMDDSAAWNKRQEEA